MDYTTTKVDFYTNYNGINYQSFYDGEVSAACNIINSGGATKLLDKVMKIIDTFNDISVEWYDEVEEEFQSYKESCISSLNIIKDSINSQFISLAEDAYKNLKDYLEKLRDSNSTYQNNFDGKPNEYNYKSDVDSSTSSQYYTELENWKTRVNNAAQAGLDLIIEIEDCKKTLSSVNSNIITVEGNSPTIDMSKLEFELPPTNNLGLAGPVDVFIATNGLPYLKIYSNWGEEFYSLANIKRGGNEEPGHCIAWANAYAKNILRRNNTPYTNIISYSTMDKQEVLGIAAKEILSGRPVVLEVTGTKTGGYTDVTVVKNGSKTVENMKKWNRHYVALYGIRKGADLSNLKDTDFLYLDPAGGQVKQLGTENGGQYRVTLNAQAATTNEKDENYCINVFSNQYNYQANSLTCNRLNRTLDWDSNKIGGGVQYLT